MYKYIFATIALVLLLAACGSSAQAECLTSLETYMPAIEDALDEWSDAVDVALSTSRINLGDQVQVMQAIKRNTEDIAPPVCMVDSHTNTTESMETIIQLFLNFMSDADYEPTDDESFDLSMAMLSLEGFPEVIKEYNADPETFVQRTFDLMATEEAMSSEEDN